MAKKLPEELEALIQEYLTDGVITDKERQVILKEAEKMKLDRDMVDLIIDARQQKIDQETDSAVRRQKGKQCPHCGAYVSQLTDKCPECGQYITPEATKELEEILDNLEEALVNMKARKDIERNKATVERYARKARMYYSNHPKIKILLAEIDADVQETENRIRTAKREEAVGSFFSSLGGLLQTLLKNKITWCVLSIAIGGILAIKGFGGSNDYYDGDSSFGYAFLGMVFILVGGYGLLAMMPDKKND